MMSGEKVTQPICATAAHSSRCRNPPAVPGLTVWFFYNTYCQYRKNYMKETKLFNFLDFIHVRSALRNTGSCSNLAILYEYMNMI